MTSAPPASTSLVSDGEDKLFEDTDTLTSWQRTAKTMAQQRHDDPGLLNDEPPGKQR